jgi:XTP/dITP diphosphohydrolase
MKKILIATTNKGKFREISTELADLPFKILSLKDLDKNIKEPEENEPTIEKNSILKAKYYSKKTGLITIADDSGLFVRSLKNWPGVKSARIDSTNTKRTKLVLEKMKGINDRKACFKTAITIYNPKEDSLYTVIGKLDGEITKKETGKNHFGYDPIFYVKEKKMTYAQMASLDKNIISHRGKAMAKLKYFLLKQYTFKQFLVPVSIIVKDGKMLMSKRRDFRPDYNKKWEFPGGGIDTGEDILSSLTRETKEESGYNIEVIEQLPEIITETRSKYEYQVFLLAYICSIKSGKFKAAPSEVLDHDWFTLAEALKKDLLPLNRKMLKNKKNIKILKKYINY